MMGRTVLASTVAVALILAGCFGEREDEDGLPTEDERRGWDITVRDANGSVETRHVTSDPQKDDSDGDGLDDFQEFLERTDPRDPDTDGDGLLDGGNIDLPANSPRALAWESLAIRYEVHGDTWRLLGERGGHGTSHGADPKAADTDGDGLSDGEEVGGFEVVVNGEALTVTTLAYVEDTDGDNLEDGEEKTLGLDPTEADTDKDGAPDSGDLNPWQDVTVRLVLASLTITNDPESRADREVWLFAQMPSESFISDIVTVQAGVPSTDEGFSSPPLDPTDDGGSVRAHEFNLTFTVTALSMDTSGETIVIDLFSDHAGSDSLFGRLNAVTGDLSLGTTTDQGPWPSTFSGAHGEVSLRLELA